MQLAKQWLTPQEVFKMFDMELPEWITFNPNLTKRNGADYEIVRTSSNDGTLIFTKELLGLVIENLANKTSYYKKLPINNLKDFKYEVGLISLATVYGSVNLPIGRNIPGERSRARMSVKCTVIYND